MLKTSCHLYGVGQVEVSCVTLGSVLHIICKGKPSSWENYLPWIGLLHGSFPILPICMTPLMECLPSVSGWKERGPICLQCPFLSLCVPTCEYILDKNCVFGAFLRYLYAYDDIHNVVGYTSYERSSLGFCPLILDVHPSPFVCDVVQKLFIINTKDPWLYFKCVPPWREDHQPKIVTRKINLSVESLVLDLSLETLDAWEIGVILVPTSPLRVMAPCMDRSSLVTAGSPLGSRPPLRVTAQRAASHMWIDPQAYNRGVTTIESLKDVCLLETHKKDSVKMHDVVRDVAIWIDNSFGNEQNSVIQAGIGLTKISHAKVSASVKRISFVGNKIEHLPDCFTKCPEATSLLLQDNEPLVEIPREFFLSFPALTVLNLSETSIRALPPSINSLCQLRALILQSCKMLKELPPIGNLCNLHVFDCDDTRLRCLPQGMDKLTNLRLLNLPAANLKESIVQGFFLELSSIEMLIMLDSERGIWNLQDDIRKRALLGPNFDEISSLHNLTSLFISLDSSAIFDKDYTWMTRLKRFYIDVGDTVFIMNNKSARTICISNCEIFSNGELFGMLQFASDLSLYKCMGLRKLIVNQKSFNGLKKLDICFCSCDFRLVEEGSGKIDPLPNLEHLILTRVDNLKSVSDFGQVLGLRFSKLHQLYLHSCASLTCLFNIGEAFSAPKNLEEITVRFCGNMVELFVQCRSNQAALVNSKIPRVRKLYLSYT
ncbi:putative disease resistance protein-like [Capsicum annuum]|nr:putative disease resistance protein-like [Capsicum annuum]